MGQFENLKRAVMVHPVNNIFPTLLQLYQDAGYVVSIGLNPRRERAAGTFAVFMRKSVSSGDPLPDEFFGSNPSPLGPSRVAEPALLRMMGLRFQRCLHRFAGTLGGSLGAICIGRRLFGVPSRPENEIIGSGGGIGLDEIYFLQCLLTDFHPQSVFQIGVACGWSLIAMGLAAPHARFIAIDNLSEGTEAREGFALTERLSRIIGMQLELCVGKSPDDVQPLLSNKGSIDLVFVDGYHSNEQVFADYCAVTSCMSDRSIILFHDILNWNMLLGWNRIKAHSANAGFESRILRRTASGMGVLFRGINDPATLRCIDAFTQGNNVLPPLS